MKSVKVQILNSLGWFLAKLKTTFTQKSDIINNCVSTATDAPLSAAQGKALSDSISALNSNLSQQISELNSNIDIIDLEYTKDPVVSFTNLSVRAFGKVVSVHGVIRTAYISLDSTLLFIKGDKIPSVISQFCYTTPEGKAGTGYVDLDGSIKFDTSKLSGSNDLYIGFSYIAK